MIAIKLRTKNDKNGNPRRGWIVLGDNGEPLEFVEEHYNGDAGLRRAYPDAVCSTVIEVAPAEFRSWVRHDRDVLAPSRGAEVASG